MLSSTKDFIKISNFLVLLVPVVVPWLDFLKKLMCSSLTSPKSLCLVLLRPAETSLMLQLYENGFSKRAAYFGSCKIYLAKITNEVRFEED